MKKYPLIFGLVIGILCCSGCGSARLDLNVASQPNVNPDNSGRPSPVLVKTYELRNDLAFKQADFQSLFGNPVQALGADLIASDELVFIPGEARKVSYKPAPETRFLGIVAGFRQMERAHWRIIKPVDPEKRSLIALEFNDTTILVVPDNEAEDWEPEEAVKSFQQQLRPRQQASPVPGQQGITPSNTMQPMQQSSAQTPGGASAPQTPSTTETVFAQPIGTGAGTNSALTPPVRVMRSY
jgi:type VI secretion system protein VasD